MQPPSTPLFVKTHDFNVWLFQRTHRFPKHLRHSLTNRIEMVALEFEEALLLANSHRDQQRIMYIELADGKLVCLRALMRYTIDFELLSSQQLRYATECTDELGRLLGAWFRGMSR